MFHRDLSQGYITTAKGDAPTTHAVFESTFMFNIFFFLAVRCLRRGFNVARVTLFTAGRMSRMRDATLLWQLRQELTRLRGPHSDRRGTKPHRPDIYCLSLTSSTGKVALLRNRTHTFQRCGRGGCTALGGVLTTCPLGSVGRGGMVTFAGGCTALGGVLTTCPRWPRCCCCFCEGCCSGGGCCCSCGCCCCRSCCSC